MDYSLLNSFDIYVIKRKTSIFGVFSKYKLDELDINYTTIPFENNILTDDENLLTTINKICHLIPIGNSSSIIILEESIVFHRDFHERITQNIHLLNTNDIIYFGDNLQNCEKKCIPFYAVLIKPDIIPLVKEKLCKEFNNANTYTIDTLLQSIIYEKKKKAIILNPNLILYPKTLEIIKSNNTNDLDFSLKICNKDQYYFSDYKYLRSTIYWDTICKLVLSNKVSLRKINTSIDDTIDNIHLSKIMENGNKSFVFIIPSFNNSLYYKKNLDSVFSQKYPFWRVIYVDDCSTDHTYDLVKKYILEKDFGKKVTLVKNNKNRKQTYSRYIAYNMCQPDEICCMLDGDDWLLNENVLTNLNNSYLSEKLLVSYGQFYYYENGKIGNLSGYYSYSEEEIQNNNYRERWITQHLRTCEASLLHTIPKNYLKYNNEWIKCCSDLAEMWWVLEKSQGRHANIGYPVYVYNKDASMTYENSYFNKDKNIMWGIYREKVSSYLKHYKCNT